MTGWWEIRPHARPRSTIEILRQARVGHVRLA